MNKNRTAPCGRNSRLHYILIPLIAFSIGSVICDSITCDEAPVYAVRTVMIGGSIEGYSRTPKESNPINPKRTMMIENTIDITGLFKLSELNDINLL